VSRVPGAPVATRVGTRCPVTAGRPVAHDVPVRVSPGVGVGVLAVLAALVGAVLYQVNAAAGRALEPSFWLLGMVGALAFAGTGAFLAARGRVPVVRRVLLGIGLGHGISLLGREYGLLALAEGAPLAAAALWIGSWTWAPAHMATGALLPLVLPDGSAPSSRWRPALALSVTAMVAQAVWWAVLPYDLQDVPIVVPGAVNPVGTPDATHLAVEVAVAGVTALAVALALVSVAVRWRRSAGERRQQLKWLLLGGGATVVVFATAFAVPQPLGEVVAALAPLPIPLACAVAALRHRLWDVDVLLSRSLLYTALSAAVVAAYVLVVGLLGGLVGTGTGAPLVATAVVALLVLPLHGRLQRLVNRLVHGEVEDPYTALARLGDRLAATADPVDVAERLLPEVARRVADLLRSSYVAVELADGTRVEHGDRPADVERTPLCYGGSDVGALVLAARAGRSGGERRRLDALGRQVGVAVHSVLLARDVRRSRQLVVTAREEERRRLRRDLHDGLGPVLAALALQAETARDLVGADPGAATALLDRLVPRLNGAVADVRSLVHELRPPTLDELGLAGAVRELAARFAGPDRAVRVELGELGVLPAAVDVAAYRIVAEALANAVRHAQPRTVTVALARNGRWLQVEVGDDGRGLDPAGHAGVGLLSMRERAEELDGRCTVAARPGGGGTVVTARLPLAVDGAAR